ncbi:LuxR C-terminal-related transcriptional regulator [Actinokineospora cianjurensis]|uniref:LuxR family two component transcriptional regulator n=1 Tax=Actinokineospora cianjurensis TaxID=585224 RepID=A0A421B7R1_9PSEU|nr:response regulator transcription factor [Actinokineospora cianjurensis]RLK60414.1 LuxR family two component transcriptional regulator [Actinokineospora cianjurensis]
MLLRGLSSYLAEHATDIELREVYPRVRAYVDADLPAPSVILLDIHIPGENDVGANVRKIRSTGAQVVLYTAESRAGVVREAIDAGALGLVLKGDPEDRLVEAIRAADAGEHFTSSRLAHTIVTDPRAMVRLTKQEREVLTLAAKGQPYRLIARKMRISEKTVPTYLARASKRYAEAGAPDGRVPGVSV